MTDETHTDLDWYSDETATFGDRLAAAREAAGLDREALARAMGIRVVTLEKWENDRTEPRANKLSTVAGVLGVSLRWLLTGEGDDLPAPGPARSDGPDMQAIIHEMREVQAEMVRQADRLGRLQKRLRLVMAQEG